MVLTPDSYWGKAALPHFHSNARGEGGLTSHRVAEAPRVMLPFSGRRHTLLAFTISITLLLICFGAQHPQPASIAQVHHFDIVAQGYEGREIVSQESIIPQGFGPFLSELSSYLTMPNGSAGGLAATTALSTPLYLDAASLDTWLCSGFTSVDSNDHYNKCTSHRNHALRN